MESNCSTFYGLYLGSICIADSSVKKALKVSTRTFVYDDDERLVQSPEVDIDILPDRVRLREHQSRNKTSIIKDRNILIEARYNLISSCFILREDNKIISIVVTNANFTSEMHVLMLCSAERSRAVIGLILNNFACGNRITSAENIAEDDDDDDDVSGGSGSMLEIDSSFESINANTNTVNSNGSVCLLDL